MADLVAKTIESDAAWAMGSHRVRLTRGTVVRELCQLITLSADEQWATRAIDFMLACSDLTHLVTVEDVAGDRAGWVSLGVRPVDSHHRLRLPYDYLEATELAKRRIRDV